jgi:hypothetical protein
MQEETELSAGGRTCHAELPTLGESPTTIARAASGVWSRRIGIAITGLLLSSRPSVADPFEDWPVKPHPHLSIASSFNDNVFISPTKQGDFSWLISPGILLEYGKASHNYITLDYTAQIERFYRLTSEDANNHLVAFRTHLGLDRLTLDLSHDFRDRTEDNVEVGGRVEERQNITHANAEYQISSKTAVGLHYRQEFHEFFAPGQINYDTYEVGGDFYYRAFSKTDLFGEVNYGWVNEQVGSDQEYWEINAGLRGRLTSKITGTVKGGYQHRKFDVSTIGDINSFVASVGLQAALTKRTTADLTVSRSVDPSITSAGDTFTATRVEATLRHRARAERLVLTLGGAYEHDDYGQLNRGDDVWEARAGVSYAFTRWFELGAFYRHTRDESSLSAFSFNQNVATIQASLHY